MTKLLTPDNPNPLGLKTKSERRQSVAAALVALFISLGFSSAHAAIAESCSDLFQPQTIELKDPSILACIKSKLGCRPKSVTLPVFNGKLSLAQYRIFFEDRKDYFWKMHQSLGLKAIIVADPRNHGAVPSLLEDSVAEELMLPARKIDYEAVQRSSIDRAPLENAIFIFFGKEGSEIARTEWIKGQKESVNESDLREALSNRLRQIDAPISRIELIHSHPVHELIIQTASESEPLIIVRHSLSQSDFQVAESMSRLIPPNIPFVISASMPSGRRYSAVFVNGKNESRSWLSRTSELSTGIQDF